METKKEQYRWKTNERKKKHAANFLFTFPCRGMRVHKMCQHWKRKKKLSLLFHLSKPRSRFTVDVRCWNGTDSRSSLLLCFQSRPSATTINLWNDDKFFFLVWCRCSSFSKEVEKMIHLHLNLVAKAGAQ